MADYDSKLREIDGDDQGHSSADLLGDHMSSPQRNINHLHRNGRPIDGRHYSLMEIARYAAALCTRPYIVRDIIRVVNGDEVERIMAAVRDQRRRDNSQFILIAHHPKENFEHVHIVHDCAWNHSSCRCAWLCKFRRERRRVRVLLAHEQGPEFYYGQMRYYNQSPRSPLYCSMGGEDWTLCLQAGDIQREGREELTAERLVESCELQGNVREPKRGLNGSLNEQSPEGDIENGKIEGLNVFAEERALEKMIRYHPAYPLNQTCNTKFWLNHFQLKFYRGDNISFKRAMNVCMVYFQSLSFEEMLEYYEAPAVMPNFRPTGNEELDLYDLPNSIYVLEELITYQHGADAHNFWISLFEVLTKAVPKTNAIQIVGAPGSGKTYLIDAISAFMLNTGNIANFNRSCNFPLQDCKNRSLLIWNEPNFTPDSEDTLKMLFGGDPCPARIKYENDYIIPRTPIIITTNIDVIPHKPAFTQRVRTYRWMAAPHLAEYTRKPNPMCIGELYRKYMLNE